MTCSPGQGPFLCDGFGGADGRGTRQISSWICCRWAANCSGVIWPRSRWSSSWAIRSDLLSPNPPNAPDPVALPGLKEPALAGELNVVAGATGLKPGDPKATAGWPTDGSGELNVVGATGGGETTLSNVLGPAGLKPSGSAAAAGPALPAPARGRGRPPPPPPPGGRAGGGGGRRPPPPPPGGAPPPAHQLLHRLHHL